MSGCGLVSGVGVTTSHLSPHLPLQFLDMSDCSRLDDTSLRLVVESCPQLQFLYLRRCTQISGQSMAKSLKLAELGLRNFFDFATSDNATTYSINKDLCGTLKYEICLLLQVEIEVSIQYLAVIPHETTCKRCQIVSIVVARAQL